ncbi:hypothetical protein AAEX28_10555 [Lentisphaerota bacterium WC36G]|nr:hypothetical protein LJT99_13400 [Lentisphaerae bacterium WC36]
MNSYKVFFKRILLLVVSATILFFINGVQKNIDESITENNLRDTGTIENAPPIVAFTTVVLGAFRGVAANLLWLRSKNLMEEGSYFEMVQISKWIQQLQPKFTGALGYLGWNMAYNISVTESRFVDRWRWVNAGVDLLRKAIAANPKDPDLYHELGWIFQHKIGATMDDAQQYYKNQIAKEMYNVLGEVRPDWDKWATLPNTFAKLEDHYKNSDPVYKALEQAGYKNFKELYEAFTKDGIGKLPEKFTAVYTDKDKLKYLDQCMRVIWLKKKYVLDCKIIAEINHKYGAFDWRLPESQALYWGYEGLKVAPEGKHANSERLVIQGLRDSWRRGALLTIQEGENAYFNFGPNFSVLDAVKKEYLKAKDNYDARSFDVGYFNFLKDAIVMLDTYGYSKQAREYYLELRRVAKRTGTTFDDNRLLFLLPMNQWVEKILEEDMDSANPTQAGNLISGFILNAFRYLLAGDMETAVAIEAKAKHLYLYYKKKNEGVNRNFLPPYSQIRGNIARRAMANATPEMSKRLKGLLMDLDAENKRKSEEKIKKNIEKLEKIKKEKLEQKKYGTGGNIFN